MSPRWDEADDAVLDDEATRLTSSVHEWARQTVEKQARCQGWGYEVGVVGASLRLRIVTPDGAYVAEVRGVSSVTGHGRQGSHPLRIARLRELDEPVLVLYAEGREANVWFGWLDRLPDPIYVNRDPVHKRMGWWCRDMEHDRTTTFRFPVLIPLPDLTALSRLEGFS